MDSAPAVDASLKQPWDHTRAGQCHHPPAAHTAATASDVENGSHAATVTAVTIVIAVIVIVISVTIASGGYWSWSNFSSEERPEPTWRIAAG